MDFRYQRVWGRWPALGLMLALAGIGGTTASAAAPSHAEQQDAWHGTIAFASGPLETPPQRMLSRPLANPAQTEASAKPDPSLLGRDTTQETLAALSIYFAPHEEEIDAEEDETEDEETSDEEAEDDEPSDEEMEEDETSEEESTRRRSRRRSRFDQATVRRGRQFFQSSCTQCHDAERALSKRKSFSGWLATVRRMAARDEADIPANEHVPIATYLASLNPANQPAAREDTDEETDSDDADASDAVAEAEGQLPPFSLNGTLSAVWRGTDDDLENRGFFPDVWVGIDWRTPDNPVSGRVMACSSCHGTNEGLGVELVEASATLDLVHFFSRCPPSKRCPGGLTADLKAGRFIVPFGAYSGRVHPGALRTVSPPLMFNMGRRLAFQPEFQPVLNMPYADEGFNLHLRHPLPYCCDWSATFDVYGVNGLQVGGQDVFFFSRSYRDNNSNVAVGGRATVGSKFLRFGGSVASGELQNELGPFQNYKLAGGDVTFRFEEKLRAFYEYAIRVENPFPGLRNVIYGNLVELEVLLCDDPKIGVLARYDTLDHSGVFGDLETKRFTWGLNFGLHGGSMLILNHEHWQFSNRQDADIMGIRWTVAF